jgi:hypothetical protein
MPLRCEEVSGVSEGNWPGNSVRQQRRIDFPQVLFHGGKGFFLGQVTVIPGMICNFKSHPVQFTYLIPLQEINRIPHPQITYKEGGSKSFLFQ